MTVSIWWLVALYVMGFMNFMTMSRDVSLAKKIVLAFSWPFITPAFLVAAMVAALGIMTGLWKPATSEGKEPEDKP